MRARSCSWRFTHRAADRALAAAPYRRPREERRARILAATSRLRRLLRCFPSRCRWGPISTSCFGLALRKPPGAAGRRRGRSRRWRSRPGTAPNGYCGEIRGRDGGPHAPHRQTRRWRRGIEHMLTEARVLLPGAQAIARLPACRAPDGEFHAAARIRKGHTCRCAAVDCTGCDPPHGAGRLPGRAGEDLNHALGSGLVLAAAVPLAARHRPRNACRG